MRRCEKMRRLNAICMGMRDWMAEIWQTGTTSQADRKSVRVRAGIGERSGEGGGAAGRRVTDKAAN